MRCPPAVALILSQIITTGLLRIRALGCDQNSGRCAIVADHLHNLPGLLTDFRPELLDYYWNIERVGFMNDSSSMEVAFFEPLWRRLAEEMDKEKQTHLELPWTGAASAASDSELGGQTHAQNTP